MWSGGSTLPTVPGLLQPLLRADERARAFGRRVVLPHDRAEPLDQPLLHVDRTRRGAVEDEDAATTCRSASLHVVGQRQQPVEHRRHHVRVRDAVLLDERAASPPRPSRPSARSARPSRRAPTSENASGAAWYSGPVHRCTCAAASYCVSSATSSVARADRADGARPSAGRSCPTCRASCRRASGRRGRRRPRAASTSSQRSKPAMSPPTAMRACEPRRELGRAGARRRRSARRRRTRSPRSRRRCSRLRRRSGAS